ncbi:capsid cement protein [Xanthobacter sp.]|uniref:capsid cement protein n=1 Tax=Xanthobacter sp. TaxID=35809 RepID=UPI0025F203D6|nr:capsid cement protein [Xanthobacter sp.]
MSPLLIKSFAAAAAVAGYRIVTLGAGGAAQGAAAPGDIIGVSDSLGADAGGMLDVIMVGAGEVTCGGNVAAGKPLTADAQGRAVQATAGAGVRIVGFALAAGAVGDVIPVHVAPGYFSA